MCVCVLCVCFWPSCKRSWFFVSLVLSFSFSLSCSPQKSIIVRFFLEDLFLYENLSLLLLPIFLGIKRLAKEDVLPECCVEEPRLLRHIGDEAGQCALALQQHSIAQQATDQCGLARPYLLC